MGCTATGVPAARYETFAGHLLGNCPSVGSVYLYDYPGCGINRHMMGGQKKQKKDMMLSADVDLAMWADALASALEHASEDSEAEVIPIGHSNGSLLLPWALRLNQMRKSHPYPTSCVDCSSEPEVS